MPKNIVLLSDGTGNSAASLTKTNVWRLYQALDLSKPNEQIAYYDDGVGTSSFRPLAIVGGAFGYGVKRNVIDLYNFVCRNYVPGDKLFLFGFSRGAFTARALTGLIACEGLVSANTEARLMTEAKTAYREYRRKRYPAAIPLDRIGRVVRDLFIGDKDYAARSAGHQRPDIDFLGVWDTVAAYGLPIDEMTRALNWVWRLYPKDREASPKVRRLCHALALDDERYTFHPMLFNEENEPGGNVGAKNIRDERITQVWFAGMHSNVGGGYPEDGLSYVSLAWIMEQARASGLHLNHQAREQILCSADPLGRLYDSRRGLGGLYRYMPRKILPLTNDVSDKGTCVRVVRPKIHESVFQRIANGSDRYAPIGLPPRYAVVTNNGDILDSSDVLETSIEAQSRTNTQEKVWNIVWWKRVVYFISIAVGCALLVFPLVMPATGACEWGLCFAAPLIGWAGALVPGFLDPWIAAYRSHPGTFLALFGAFILLIWIGTRIQVRIGDAMRALWTRSMNRENLPDIAAPLPSDLLFKVRTHPAYLGFFAFMKKQALPALFAFLAVCILAGATSRLFFSAFGSQGLICKEAASESPFIADSLCWDSRIDVQQGKTYEVALTIGDGPYTDGDIRAGLGGFGLDDMPLSFKIAQPVAVFFRRYLREPWFKPIARVGAKGTDEYVLEPPEGETATSSTRRMTAKITPRRSGRLFLFVNDAVLPVLEPDWQVFYTNNRGNLRVDVKQVMQ